ncbi:rhodanese-like domain-containing protein (plasmid) [Halarchaeum sp. CBA1220]|uniref:rhodanese-like domain-containing protein n=1 Tax=Halarchaeum sp. CBA1220 TaxID=1853682 RepID=UPI0013149B66|nr:rhodanese-like domain-containing protein [Halarchaeum sp. CBA1220]QLC35506.1 rhodanese-like domain-containing protein [Halarchaeum sp. CBA1220]
MSNTITSSEVWEQASETFVLDVRPSYSYHETHIPGSHNLPIYDQLSGENFIGLDASLTELPEDREIAVVCFSGSKAALAASRLREHGYDAKRMVGGMNGWSYVTTSTTSPSEPSASNP